MQVIDRPTIRLGESGNDLLRMVKASSRQQAIQELERIVQDAFDAGMGVTAPPHQKPVEVTRSGNTPVYRDDWDAIDEDGPQNPIERFIHTDLPNPDDPNSNVAAFLARLKAALDYAAKS